MAVNHYSEKEKLGNDLALLTNNVFPKDSYDKIADNLYRHMIGPLGRSETREINKLLCNTIRLNRFSISDIRMFYGYYPHLLRAIANKMKISTSEFKKLFISGRFGSFTFLCYVRDI